jgi:hypothetical protein
MQLYAALGPSRIYTKGPAPETGTAWSNALEMAERLEDTEFQLRALRGLWAFRLNIGQYRAALSLAQRFCDLASNANPADSLVGERMTGTALHYLGDQTNARLRLEHMLAAYTSPARGPHAIRFQFDQQVTARATLARILCLQGFYEQSMRMVRSSIADAEADEHALLLCNVLVQAACPIALWAGDLAAAERYIGMLFAQSERHGLTLWRLRAQCYRGLLLNRAGDAVTGSQLLGTALDELRGTAFAGHYASFLGAFAGALGRSGQLARGLVLIEEALARCERSEGHWYLAELLRRKGELIWLQRTPNAASAAEEQFLTALDWARRQGALAWELRAATNLAALWRDEGRVRQARELLAPVYGRFSEGLDTADLVAAKALLDAL